MYRPLFAGFFLLVQFFVAVYLVDFCQRIKGLEAWRATVTAIADSRGVRIETLEKQIVVQRKMIEDLSAEP